MQNGEQIRTNVKKRLFIMLYKKTLGSVKATCDKVGVERRTYYNWLKNDSEFDSEVGCAFREIQEDLEEALNFSMLRGDGASIRFFLSRGHPNFMRMRND
jgi:hypothetical protein